MPRIEELKDSKLSRRPTTLDREQLEYTLQSTLTYGVIAFTVVGVLASITYMTIQQLKK